LRIGVMQSDGNWIDGNMFTTDIGRGTNDKR